MTDTESPPADASAAPVSETAPAPGSAGGGLRRLVELVGKAAELARCVDLAETGDARMADADLLADAVADLQAELPAILLELLTPAPVPYLVGTVPFPRAIPPKQGRGEPGTTESAESMLCGTPADMLTPLHLDAMFAFAVATYDEARARLAPKKRRRRRKA